MNALMLLGTASGVGKSLLTAGFCRLLARAGARVAPFKSQNMSNNAMACPTGGEIGRAQALQAFACGLEPHVDMNPVLIKPETNCRAQLVVLGRRRATLHAARFRQDREPLLPTVVQAFGRLRKEYDWVWVEGAGSPAEPNLRCGDIANMGFAEAVDLDAWLIGDIDRGGVFGALLGTLAVLDPRDRERVRGLIVNGFRGDEQLLGDALPWLTKRARVPVLGCVPFVPNLLLPDEDAPYRQLRAKPNERSKSAIRVAAIQYPTASNLTDLDALVLDPDVEVHLVCEPRDLESYDLVVLPGSKAVLSDLRWLRARGFLPHLSRHLRYGGIVLGICGGMQMLGERISDPLRIEGENDADGLGWLPLKTELQAQKEVRVVRACAAWPSFAPFVGYEIHHGGGVHNDRWYPFNCVSEDRRVWGTYVHGLFDSGLYRRDVLNGWFSARCSSEADLHERWHADLDRLADTLAAHLDLSWLEKRVGRVLG